MMPEDMSHKSYEVAFHDGGRWIRVLLTDTELIDLMNTKKLGGVSVSAITLRAGLIYDFATDTWRAHSCRDSLFDNPFC